MILANKLKHYKVFKNHFNCNTHFYLKSNRGLLINRLSKY